MVKGKRPHTRMTRQGRAGDELESFLHLSKKPLREIVTGFSSKRTFFWRGSQLHGYPLNCGIGSTFVVIEDVLEVLSLRSAVFLGRLNTVRTLRPRANFQSCSEGRIMMSNATLASLISICFAFRTNRKRCIGGRLEGESWLAKTGSAHIAKGGGGVGGDQVNSGICSEGCGKTLPPYLVFNSPLYFGVPRTCQHGCIVT